MEALLCKNLGDRTADEQNPNSPIIVEKKHPIPELGSPKSVRVRVKATSLNYANYLQVLGKYLEKPPLPFIPGSDFSGVVGAVGRAVSNFKVGDPVCSFAVLGTFAQFVVIDETHLIKVPEGCDLVEAGALPVAFGTSHVALVHRANLSRGQGCTKIFAIRLTVRIGPHRSKLLNVKTALLPDCGFNQPFLAGGCGLVFETAVGQYQTAVPGKGILFSKNTDVQSIDLYTDADLAGATDSTSGYFTFVGDNLATWRCKKQHVLFKCRS